MNRFFRQVVVSNIPWSSRLSRWLRLALTFGCLLSVGCQETSSQSQTAAPTAPAMPAQPATAGVAQQGASLADDTAAQKIITGAAHEYFQFKQRAVFEMQIPKALELYKALNGAGPKSHAEFDREIVKANQIVLPELKPGMVYRFNTEKQELWVYPESEAPSAN